MKLIVSCKETSSDEKQTEPFVSGSKGEDRGCPKGTVGKGAKERRSETKRCEPAEKENDVGCRQKEDCGCTTRSLGEGEIRKEIGLNVKLNLKEAQTHEMSLGVLNCRSCAH